MPDAPPEPISSLRNLGPATEDAFARVGITNVGQLRALGADAAYQKLIENGQRPHFISYYVLVMALQGRPWNDCRGPRKLHSVSASTKSRPVSRPIPTWSPAAGLTRPCASLAYWNPLHAHEKAAPVTRGGPIA